MTKKINLPTLSTVGPRLRAGLRSNRVRAGLALGVGATVAVAGTMATWSDSAQVDGISIGTGSLALQVSSDGTTFTENIAGWTGMNATGLGPGGSTAGVITVKNSGTAPLKASVTGAVGTDAAGLNGYLTLKVFKGGTASGGACSGGTQVGANAAGFGALDTSADGVTVAAGATQAFCIQATVDAATPGTMQTKSMTASLTFVAGS